MISWAKREALIIDMKNKFDLKDYNIPESGVSFRTDDKLLQAVFDDCEAKCLLNLKEFGDYKVLIEGAKYNGVWLETQPMGGEMYAKRNIAVALANILIFLRYQRRDGKYPGMISKRDLWQSVAAHYDWMQGCFLPSAALRMYYLIGEDKEYLKTLFESLKDFDNYLWTYRDSNGDGCLENWCIWDVGEDNSTVYMLKGLKMPEHGAFGKSTPPRDYMDMPYESPQYMGYSCLIRDTLAKISDILDNGEAELWREGANKVRALARRNLWDEVRHAFFMKNKHGEVIDALTQENIKCLYCGLFTKDMADAFIKEHLFNENEFYTPYPFPAIAINDPYFHLNANTSNCAKRLEEVGGGHRDIDDNSWSGPINGLVWQRSIDALLNYGYHYECALVGKKILHLLKRERKYVQNYNPFTGAPSKGEDGYGPTMLSALEYISLLYGINIRGNRIYWSVDEDAKNFEYSQKMHGNVYNIVYKDGVAEAYINEILKFKFPCGARIETDKDGNLISCICISHSPISPNPLKKNIKIGTNEVYLFD